MALLPVFCIAQYYDYIPVGARSIGMGGTGIASARGGEAIYYNPALMGMDETVEFTLSGLRRYEAKDWPVGSYQGLTEGSHIMAHLASVVVPLSFQNNRICLGISHSHPIEPVIYASGWSGGIDVFSPTLAIRMNDRIRIGMAANIWTGGMKRELDNGSGSIYTAAENEHSGFNSTIGVLVTLLEYYQQHKVYLGASMKSGFDLKVDGKVPILYVGSISLYENRNIGMPIMTSIGLSWVFNNRTTFAVDYEYAFDRTQPNTSPPDEVFPVEYGYAEDSHNFRFGSEYLLQLQELVLPIRMGYRTFGTPFLNEDGSQVLGEALSIGLGVQINWAQLDIAYEKVEFAQRSSWMNNREIPESLPRAAVNYQINSFVVSATVNIEELW